MEVRASQVVVEALVRAGGADLRASQIIIEVLGHFSPTSAPLIVSQLVAEILLWRQALPTPPIYPTLPGLGYSVIKRPVFYNAGAKSGSGWSVRVGYADQPTWEWDLVYDVLKDQTSTSDLKKLLGFFLGMNGDLTPFLFLDPDDNAVLAQPIGTTDGTTRNWTLVRTYGSGSVGVENVGYVNVGLAFHVYLNAVLQSAADYDVLVTIPGTQQLSFHSAPTTGQAITVDMSYYYYVHFKDPTNDFEKFAHQFWMQKKLTLESLRG